jgi:hypothetical protein
MWLRKMFWAQAMLATPGVYVMIKNYCRFGPFFVNLINNFLQKQLWQNNIIFVKNAVFCVKFTTNIFIIFRTNYFRGNAFMAKAN